jgi:hypothetical protein
MSTKLAAVPLKVVRPAAGIIKSTRDRHKLFWFLPNPSQNLLHLTGLSLGQHRILREHAVGGQFANAVIAKAEVFGKDGSVVLAQ